MPAPEEQTKTDLLNTNDNTKDDEKHENHKKNADEWVMPELKAPCYKKKGRYFTVVVYPESLPEGWLDSLCAVGVPFAVSPLHDKDINPDGTQKKEHYHLLFTYANTTTLKAFAEWIMPLLRCPAPQICVSARGMYRYFTHSDNPEKYQYESSEIETYCGFEIPVDTKDVREIKQAIECYAIENGVIEYAEMSVICARISPEWYDVFSNHTVHFGRFFSSLRNSYTHIEKVYKEMNAEDKND